MRLGDLRHSTSNDELDAIEAFMWLIRTALPVMMRCSATGRVQTGHGSPSLEETGVSKTGSRFYAGSGTIPIQNMVLSRTSMSVYGCQTFSASLRRCQFGYRRCGRVARRRQVAEAVGSSSHLTPRWRKPDSNPRSRVTRPRSQDRLMSPLLISRQRERVGANMNRHRRGRRASSAGPRVESCSLQRRV